MYLEAYLPNSYNPSCNEQRMVLISTRHVQSFRCDCFKDTNGVADSQGVALFEPAPPWMWDRFDSADVTIYLCSYYVKGMLNCYNINLYEYLYITNIKVQNIFLYCVVRYN